MYTNEERIPYENDGSAKGLSMGFAIFVSLLILLSAFHCGKEIVYYVAGDSVVCTMISDDSYKATGRSENGQLYTYEVSRKYNKIVDNQITFYYMNGDMTKAIPMTRPWIWLCDFAIMFSILGFFLYRMYRMDNPRVKHAE